MASDDIARSRGGPHTDRLPGGRADEPAARELPPDLVRLARLMDSAVRLPGGFRVGLDGIVGLLPGVGDALGAGVSLYIVGRAYKLGASRSVLARMLANVGVEGLIGAVPVVGDLFDFAFKANERNLALLRRRLDADSNAGSDRRARP